MSDTVIKNEAAQTVVQSTTAVTTIQNISSETVVQAISSQTVVQNVSTQTSIKVLGTCISYAKWIASLTAYDSNEDAVTAGLVSGQYYKASGSHVAVHRSIPIEIP